MWAPSDRAGHSDPIGEEARRWQWRQRLDARQPAGKAAGCLLWLGFLIGGIGPFLGVCTLMAGPELVIPITVISGGAAGLVLAVGLRGIRGALAALCIPLGWMLLAAEPLMSGGTELTSLEGREILAAIALFILAIAASVEAGYLAGRLVARLLRASTSARK